MKKQKRGSYDYRYDRTNKAIVVEWHDNNVVAVASNTYGIFPIKKARRWSAKDRAEISIDQPNLINVYNQTMGGVDRADQNIGAYRIQMRSKKWWWPFFAFYLDASMQNAWLLYRKTEGCARLPLDQLGFRRSVVQVLLMRHKQERQIGRPIQGRARPIERRVPDEIRRDGINHHLRSGTTQRRCAQCKKKTKMLCSKCDVPVHLVCSEDFHK
jgi:hypothetical protein